MALVVGNHTYEVEEGWGRLPEGWTFTQAAGLVVDAQDRVIVFCRGEHPVITFDREGRFLNAWGEGVFKMPHCACLGPDGALYLVDAGDHTVRVFTTDGELLRTMGTVNEPRTEAPFNKPTGIAFAPDGGFYVSDGYGNSKVHHFTADGRLIRSWGRPGEGPGEFRLPHGVRVDRQGRVYVADRENHRIQVFTAEGAFVTQWTGLRQPCDLYFSAEGTVYVPELQHRVSFLSLNGSVMSQWGGEKDFATGAFVAPHAAGMDSRGDLYVGEVLEGQRVQKFVRKA